MHITDIIFEHNSNLGFPYVDASLVMKCNEQSLPTSIPVQPFDFLPSFSLSHSGLDSQTFYNKI